jgi:superfamily II DNA or RNA helicase
VCSDSTVKEASSDDNSVLVQDLGIKVENNPQEIADWLTRSGNSTSVVFTTYQSGLVTSEASRLAGITFDLGIFDEAHKTVGRNEQLFAHMLFDENVSIRKRLFMTATERQYRGESEDIISMDDSEVYGDTFELLTFKEALAIRPPILCDYKIVTLAVTTDEIKELLQANVFVRPEQGKVDEEVEAKMLAAALQLRKTMLNYPLKHCISFHSSIARAVAFQKTQENINNKFPKYNKLNCFHIQGSMPTSLRKRYLDEAIKSPQSLVTNAKCLTEGVDVKQIDGVLFVDPKGSTIDIVQSAGRALRPHKDKDFGYILVPIVLDSDKLRERIEQNEAYSDILIAIRALASSDDRIVDYFKSVAEGKSFNKQDSPILFSVSDSSVINLEEFANDVCLKLWDKLAKLSWMPFEEARVFARSLNFKSLSDWKRFCSSKSSKKPADVPSSPDSTYANKGWLGWSDWLGNETVSSQKRNWREFEKAKSFVQGLKIGSRVEWNSYCRGKTSIQPSLPNDIPKNPHLAYAKSGWQGYGDWMGTGRMGTRSKRKKQWRHFSEARKYARSLNLISSKEWNDFSKGLIDGLIRPDDIPSNPNATYAKEGWVNWTDWLIGQDESQ